MLFPLSKTTPTTSDLSKELMPAHPSGSSSVVPSPGNSFPVWMKDPPRNPKNLAFLSLAHILCPSLKIKWIHLLLKRKSPRGLVISLRLISKPLPRGFPADVFWDEGTNPGELSDICLCNELGFSLGTWQVQPSWGRQRTQRKWSGSRLEYPSLGAQSHQRALSAHPALASTVSGRTGSSERTGDWEHLKELPHTYTRGN